jgi:two-component system OmpR family sensor kinase
MSPRRPRWLLAMLCVPLIMLRWIAAMPSRLRRAQLRTRVLAGVLAITLVAIAAFDVTAVTALRGYLLGQTDSQLRNVLKLAQPLSGPRNFAISQARPPGRAQASNGPGFRQTRKPPLSKSAQKRIVVVGPRLLLPLILGQYFVVFVPSHASRVSVGGNPNLRSRLPDNLSVLAASHRARTVTGAGNAPLRLQAIRADNGILVVTTSLSNVDRTVGRLELIIAIGSLATALLVGLGVAWVVRRGLRPIEMMAGQADRITAGDLTDRVSPHDPGTEVGRLGTALNGMLARIEASIEEREASQELTRRFFADASHELRNPLASLRANAELYQQGALPDRQQVDEAMRRITHEAQRMSALTDDMLRLARLDQRPGQHYDPVDLTALIRECAQRGQTADPGRTWHAHIADGLVTTGDEELLRRAIDNLLANVRAHTPHDTVATISAVQDDSAVTIDVSDNGPGVPADQLPRIFDRFYRAGQQPQRPGSGLGLAIVAAIAATHDGTAEAAPGDARGLRITLTLPASSQPCPGLPLPVASIIPDPHASSGPP